jgi:hypothetical protein
MLFAPQPLGWKSLRYFPTQPTASPFSDNTDALNEDFAEGQRVPERITIVSSLSSVVLQEAHASDHPDHGIHGLTGPPIRPFSGFHGNNVTVFVVSRQATVLPLVPCTHASY